MNDMILSQPSSKTSQVTMTSLDIVDFINDFRIKNESNPAQLSHADFMKKVPKVLGSMGLGKFSDTYVHAQNGQTYPCFRFPKREACLMAMSYSYELQAQVFDRMTAMEQHIAAQNQPSYAIADPIKRAEKWIEEEKCRTSLQAKVEEQAPKVAFVERYVEGKGNKTFREVAKILKIKENAFRDFLTDKKIMYKLNGEWMAYTPHTDAKRFYVVTGTSENGHAYTRCLFTPKGIEWLAGELAKDQVRKGGDAL